MMDAGCCRKFLFMLPMLLWGGRVAVADEPMHSGRMVSDSAGIEYALMKGDVVKLDFTSHQRGVASLLSLASKLRAQGDLDASTKVARNCGRVTQDTDHFIYILCSEIVAGNKRLGGNDHEWFNAMAALQMERRGFTGMLGVGKAYFWGIDASPDFSTLAGLSKELLLASPRLFKSTYAGPEVKNLFQAAVTVNGQHYNAFVDLARSYSSLPRKSVSALKNVGYLGWRKESDEYRKIYAADVSFLGVEVKNKLMSEPEFNTALIGLDMLRYAGAIYVSKKYIEVLVPSDERVRNCRQPFMTLSGYAADNYAIIVPVVMDGKNVFAAIDNGRDKLVGQLSADGVRDESTADVEVRVERMDGGEPYSMSLRSGKHGALSAHDNGMGVGHALGYPMFDKVSIMIDFNSRHVCFFAAE